MKRLLMIISWIAQINCILILLPAAYLKLTSHPDAILLFGLLDMEPHGRFIIGTIELLACGLLLSPRFAASGALIALGTMLGALIAHLSKLGYEPKMLMASVALFLCLVIITIRRKEIPFFGSTFD